MRTHHRVWLLALVALACTRSDPPNVLLVTLDTTRADRLGAYGFGAARTPNLDAFAREAVLYEQAYAPSSWTLPSHASLFTGLLPRQHGAQTAPDGVSEPLGYAVRPLDERFRTLAERLADAGYRTAGVVAGPALSGELGVGQGFALYDDDFSAPGAAANGRRAEPVVDRAIAAMRDGDRPWFVFVNLFDPHAPYRPPAPHDAGLPQPDLGRLTGALVARLTSDTGTAPETWEQETIRALLAGYDAEIAYMDLHLGRLLAAADAAPGATFVAITSDHGESFGEHGYLSHGAHLYEDNLHVPLLVRAPGAAPRRVATPTGNRALFAGILAAAGLPVPAGAPRLDDRHGWLLHEVGPSDANVRLFGAFFDRRLHALRVPPHKLIVSSRGPAELYDVAADPAEASDLAGRDPDLRRRLEARLAEVQRDHPPLFDAASRAELSAETREALERLGYLEGED
ncbi:MAG: sulfatase [Myxococcota bacterium]